MVGQSVSFGRKLQYLGGLPEFDDLPKARRAFMSFEADEVVVALDVLVPREGWLGQPVGKRVRHRAGVGSLDFVSVENAGTKSNVAAIAFFGTLGLGARRHWSVITIGFPEGEAMFVVREQLFEVRAKMRQAFASCPSLEAKLIEGGPPSAEDETTAVPNTGSGSLMDELERLAGLYERGLVTDEEFAALKAKLIADGG